MTKSSPIEQVLIDALPWLAAGLGVALPLLLLPNPTAPLAVFGIQLTAIVGGGYAMTFALLPHVDASWFEATALPPSARRFASGTVVVIVVTGVVALVTMATSAALRIQPSLQFLQLLSALDIAWSLAALVIGVRWLFGRRVALIAGAMLGAVCVASIWNYLRVVGFTDDGGWLVDGAQIARLVLPFDVVAAIAAVGALVAGARTVQEMSQLSPQS